MILLSIWGGIGNFGGVIGSQGGAKKAACSKPKVICKVMKSDKVITSEAVTSLVDNYLKSRGSTDKDYRERILAKGREIEGLIQLAEEPYLEAKRLFEEAKEQNPQITHMELSRANEDYKRATNAVWVASQSLSAKLMGDTLFHPLVRVEAGLFKWEGDIVTPSFVWVDYKKSI